MSPQKKADTTRITPYLTHIVEHHGHLTLIPPDNAGRLREAKPRKGPKSSSNAQSQIQSVSRSSKITPMAAGRRTAERNAQSYVPRRNSNIEEDYPDYPPPSFAEAIATPPVSVYPSTISLLDTAPHPHVQIPLSTFPPSPSSPTTLSDTDDEEQDPAEPGPSRGRRPGRGVLDSESEHELPEAMVKTRHLSLSPLRTLFPSRLTPRERTVSVHQASSPYAHPPHSAHSFFKSSTTLASPSSPISISSSVESFKSEGRKLFSRGKEKAKGLHSTEEFGSWEILDRGELSDTASSSQLPVPIVSDSGTSFTDVIDITNEHDRLPIESETTTAEFFSATSQSPNHVHTRPPPSSSSHPTGTVRSRRPPPPPPPLKVKPKIHAHSPLSSEWRHSNASSDDVTVFERALEVPLPSTPHATTVDYPFPTQQEDVSNPYASLPHLLVNFEPPHGPNTPTTPIPGQHYFGRPLPRTPVSPNVRHPVDSLFSGPANAPLPANNTISCPEGLLIDLSEGSVTPSALEVTPSHASSSSSVSVIEQSDVRTPQSQNEAGFSDAVPFPQLLNRSGERYSQVTDLDLLVSRLEDAEVESGLDYETLIALEDFIGPANVPSSSPFSHSKSTPQEQSTVVGNVVVERRRVTKDGRVKLKLSMRNVAVDKCGICLTQFKENDSAAMSAICKHVFHERCLVRWLKRSQTCPLCRVTLHRYGP